MKKASFKKAIEALGYKIEKYTKGYNFRSAFASKDGQLLYFSLEDLRDDKPSFMYRTANSINDYTGGVNRWDGEDRLADIGIEIKENRSRGDYNSL